MAHTKKGRKVALVAGLALVVLSVVVVWIYWTEIPFLGFAIVRSPRVTIQLATPCQDRSKNTPHHKPAANPPWDRRRM